MKPEFKGGPNIAMKVPSADYEATLRFYRDVVGLPELDAFSPNVVFQFGASLLWVDRVPNLELPEIWLELLTPDTAAAAEHLAKARVERDDAVENLPSGFDGFWIRNPAALVHLITK